MVPIIDLEECIKDSPLFREVIDENAEDIDNLELKLDKIVRLCNGMVDSGKVYIGSQNSFINGIREISSYFEGDLTVVTALQRFIHALQEVTKYQTILMDQAQRSVMKNLNKFIKTDIKQVKDTKKHFEKISDDLDNALIRHSQVPRSKSHECDEANNLLTATRSCFRYTALDYVYYLSTLQSRKRYELLDTLLSLMHAYTTYFHQGSDLFQDFDPFFKQLETTLTELHSETSELEKKLDGRHNMVNQKDFVPTIVKEDNSSNSVIRLEGYLFKRTSNAFKTWNRRWFIIQNNQLVYRKRTRDNLTVMEDDLRLCTVKPAVEIDRRFCFEVLSPSKSHMLQADSDEGCQQWITAMQAGINAALHQPMREKTENDSLTTSSTVRPCNVTATPPPKPPRAHNQILALPGNELCCDCKSPDPRWASINLGITLCIECSGIHRSLGVHVSKVRSLTLDAWEPELLKVMAELGNTLVNRFYEAKVDETVAQRATADCPRNIRELWIKAKYVQRAFVIPLPSLPPLNVTNINGDENSVSSGNPTRWRVRKLNRRRRNFISMEGNENSLLLNSLNSVPDRKSSASSESSMKSVPSSEGLAINIVAPTEPIAINNESNEEDNKPIISLATTGRSLGSQSLLSIEKSVDEDILIFGDIEDISQSSNLELDSADESPTMDEENDDENIPIDNISELHPDLLLYRAAAVHNLSAMCEALAANGNPNWANMNENGEFALHQAIRSGSIMACEYLILNAAKCNNKDISGRTALHLATDLGHTGQVCLLLKRGVDQSAEDNENKTALALAIEKANADIVTLLRLAKLNEEMRRDEFGNPGDETFNEVVRDFSHMASHNPEKLRRQPSISDG